MIALILAASVIHRSTHAPSRLKTVSIFDQVIGTVERSYKFNADPFSAREQDLSYVGKPVTIRIPFVLNDSFIPGLTSPYKFGATYTYRSGSLSFLIQPGNFRTVQLKEQPLSLSVSSRILVDTSYQGSNSFGARRTVSKLRTSGRSVLLINPPLTKDRDDLGNDVYTRVIEANAPVARKIALDTDVEIDGNIAAIDDKDGHKTLGSCYIDSEKPTIDSPMDFSTTECGVAIDTKRIAIIRRSTGELIAEWDN